MNNWLNTLVDASPAKRHIAYAGELEFAGCTEDDRTGRTVTFLLRRPVEELTSAHPFSAHTRRRRGHAGTLFEMSLAALDDPKKGALPPIGMFSVMLLNWGASPKGETAKFLLNFEQEKHPFLVCQRAAREQQPTRWMAVFVETDDQSQPVDQAQRAAIEQPRKPKQQIRNSNLAAQFTKNPRFWQYMSQMFGYVAIDEDGGDSALKAHLTIDSKADLDRPGTRAAAEFEDLRIDFVEWQEQTFGPIEG
jgi:hypothetical protein